MEALYGEAPPLTTQGLAIMSDTTYHVYFTNKNKKREFLNENFYSEDKAQKAVEKLINKGFDDATYEGFTFDIRLP